MNQFQTTISTCAALGTIAVTSITAYKAIENNKIYNAEQEAKIEQLQTQLKQLPPLTQPPPVELPPVATPDSTKEGSAQVPPPLPLP
jgi:hypothetical protein